MYRNDSSVVSIANDRSPSVHDAGSRASRSSRFRKVVATLLLPAALFATVGNARAQAIIQDYYVPMPEAQIRTAFLALAPATNATMDSVISIVVAVAGTHVVYDHWEDGYEPDLNNPVQATTQIWGDGNNANGIPPGFVNDPSSFSYGAVLALRNLVTLPRNPATVLYDGRDRVGATRGIVMSRSAWATSPGPLLADATEVQSTIDWGTSYVMPIGQDVVIPTPVTSSFFELVSMMVMAQSNNTSVSIDFNGDGLVNGADFTTVINQGESYHVPSGVLKGTRVTSTKPVQVQLLTGDIGANYESRWYTIPSTDQWTPEYYSPVGTASNGEATYIFLYNNNATAITINYTTQTGSGSFSIPAKSTYNFLAPQNSGTKFTSAGGQDFFAVGAAGAALTSNNVHDWGFDLVPTENLTTELVVGWGPGSSDGTQNGSPVWVTPTGATTIYVDYNGDHLGALTDPIGGKYDLAITSAALQVSRIFEADRDQTGMRLYTLDGTLITGAWGQDPATAGPAMPYLDVGTTVPNFPVPTMTKTSTLFNDVAPAGLSIGDTLTYTITVNNQGLVAIGNTIVLDTLPAALSYVPNTTTRDSVAIPDAGVTAFPLDEGGITVPILPRRSSTVITFRAVIAAAGSIVNTATSSTGAVSVVVTPVPPGTTNQCVLDFTNSGGTTVSTYTPGTPVYVTVTDADANTSSGSAQSFAVTVTDTNTGDLETITLTETGVNTGIFRNSSGLATSETTGLTPNDGTLYVQAGDSLVVNYTDPLYGDTCNDALSVSVASATKVLYLDTDGSDGDAAGDLDRVDPVNTADGSTSNTSTLAAPAAATVTAGATTSGTTSNATSVTFSHTAGSGSNRLLLVAVGAGGTTNNSNPGTISSVTYNGTALTLVGGLLSTQARTAIYALANPVAGPANVVVTMSAASSIAASATTFTGVDLSSGLTSALGTYTSNSGATGSPSRTITATTSQLVFTTAAADEGASNQTFTTPVAQTELYNGSGLNFVTMAASTRLGTGASMTLSYTSGDTTQEWAMGAVPINPAAGTTGGSATFTQTPALCENLVLPAGSVLQSQVYFSTISGTMPASPSITAELKYGATTVATSTSASSDGTKLTFTFPALGALTTIPSGSALQLVVSNNQSGVTFQIQYDSSTKPSFVSIPTTTVIHVDSVGVYDAAYSGGSLTSSANNGATLYVRTVVGDPFGFADITSLPLTIDGPGAVSDVSTTLTDANMVASSTCQKTYEYPWATGVTQGTYTITAQANEGFENTVTDSRSTTVTLNQQDLGTACNQEFTTGSNGPGTTTYAANEQVCVRVTDLDQNTNAAAAETVGITITSSAGDSEARTLTETGVNTGIFVGCTPASSTVAGTNNNGTLYVPTGASLTAGYTDPTDSLDVCSDSGVVPSGSPAIQLTKTLLSPADGQAVVGEAVQYRVRVVNTGNTTLATVALGDTFPAANLTYVSASPSPNTVGAGSLGWTNIGPMVSGATVDVIVNFTALASPVTNPVVNSATANAGGGVTSTDTENVIITNPSLTVAKTLVSPSPGPAAKGANVVWSIVVTNNGNTAIDALPFEDTYSGACFTYVSASAPLSVPTTPDGTGYGSIFWSDITGAGSLAAGASTTLSVTLQASGACNPGTNTASASFVTDTYGDPVPPASSSATIVTTAANISGFVLEDVGTAGFGGGDTALAGVTVSLYTDPNGDGDPSDGVVVQTQQTLSDGSYDFVNLGLGNYVVVESDPLGYNSIADTQGAASDNRVAVNVVTLTSYPNNNFLDDVIDVSTYGSIAGQVRNDTDGDGDLGDTDSGIASVTVELYTDPNGDGDPSDGVLFLSTTTDGSGNYSFPSIPPGNYVVVEVNPVGYNSTNDYDGLNDDRIGVTVPSATAVTGRNFLDTTLSLADLSITKTDGVASYTAGGVLTYTVVATNNGPTAVVGATVTDTFPVQLTNASWTCSGSGGGTCTASGSGNISQLVNLPAGGSVTFVVSAQVLAGATVNPLTNTATVAVPSGSSDLVPGNNSASDSDSPTAAPGSIGDRLWLDENGNGVQDAGEDGIAGVTIGLYDATGVTLLATATTDTDGRYVFSGVAAGNYVVRVDTTTMPAGLAANPTYDFDNGTTSPDGQTAVTAVAGVYTDTADFGYNWVAPATSTNPPLNATGAIGDRIWNDADGDGVQDFGEAGISGVTVRLLVDSNGDGVYGGVGDAAAVTTTTSASGNYIFDGIAPGGYVIQVDTTTLPAGFTTTPTGDPDGDLDSTSNPIALAPGDVFLRADFGYTRPTGRTIGDTIYLDRNASGTLDAGEPGIAGVTVTLLDNSGRVIASTTTDSTGNYSFPGLPDGTYTVVVTDAAGILLDTPTNTGDPDGGTARRSTVVIAGANNLLQDFGFAPAGHAAGEGLIGDTIFLDRDLSGGFNAGEGLQGVTVNLYDQAGTTLLSTVVTDANGQYVFGGLDATATYQVRVDTTTLPGGGAGLTNSVDPDGGTANRAQVNLTLFAGGTTVTQDFGYTASTPNTISGTVWNDANGDGSLTGGETGRFANVVIVLRDASGDVVATTTTDASGNYSFTGLPDGTYTVSVAENGNVLGGRSQSTGATPGADNNSQSAPYTVTVTGGATNGTGDFGYFVPGAALGNFVWDDLDNDGIQDVGEPGIEHVLVTLTITWPNGNVSSLVVETDASGAYAFRNLLLDEQFDGAGAGEPTYVLSAALPPGYTASPIGAGGDPQLDSNDPSGATATVSQGVTNTTDNSLASNGFDFGLHPPACTVDADCDDGLFCSGVETCVAFHCVAGTDPCAGGDVCGNVCNETADNCLVPAGTLCRAAAGICDTPETCTGSSTACPADSFASNATVCRASGGICDVAENCTGASATCPADSFVSNGTVCRASGGVCDVAEACTGTAAACPVDSFASNATVCRASGGVCDVAETCTGASATCPADGFASNATVCRASGGVCDVAENCTGSAAACPADSFASNATVCRASGGVCDVAENCTGSAAACPVDGFASNATVCRASGGVCDVAENCTGSSSSCPADSFASNATVCRASGGVCDVAENCTGSAAACPVDGFASNATVCRASGGVCDVAENCTGSSAACPADTFVANTTVCRGSAGVCDVAETCTGSAAACPADSFLPNTFVCRADAGECDVAETCTGSSAACPANAFEPVSTACGSAGDTPCDNPDTCDGSGTCLTNPDPGSPSCIGSTFSAGLGDRVWLDEDGDGFQDAGEDGLAGVVVQLYDATGTVLITTTVTDTDGGYLFPALAAGPYVIRVDTTTLPAGLAANPTYDLDSGTTAPDAVTDIVAQNGSVVTSGDFGFNWVPPTDSSNPGPAAPGAIGDRIWNDADGDGVQDFGEAGIGGVTVRLLVDSNGDGTYGGVGDSAAVTAVTDAAGNYIFNGIAPGAYVLSVDTATLPAGFSTTPTGDPDSDGDNTSEPIVLAPGDVYVRGDFGYALPTGHAIGSSVYFDADADGTRDPGEPGQPGVTVLLLDGGGNVIASTTTDASGNYEFPGLPDGSYSVVVTDTAGVLIDTPANTGDPDGGNDRTSAVVLAGADNLVQDFGFTPAAHAPGDGLIGDTVFLDRDGNGTPDPGEVLEDVFVELYDASGTALIAVVVTDHNGHYYFGGLDPSATYVVRIDPDTLPGAGLGLSNTVDPEGAADGRAVVDLSGFAGGITLDQDFGYEADTPNTIGGTLWDDVDGDGLLEPGETGRFAGVTLVLLDPRGDVVGMTVTDASGNYSFTGLPDGTYDVDVLEEGNQLGGLSQSDGPTPGADDNSQLDAYTVTVAGGVTDTTGDFGYYAPGAAVGNFVWEDTDNDGIQDVGEPGIAGAVVTLTVTYPNGDVTTVVTTSDALGAYSFGNLLLDENFDGLGAGEPAYSIAVSTPSGYQPSPVAAGGDPLVDSNNPAGSAATASQGVTDTTDNALASNGIDFGFAPLTDVEVLKTGPASIVPGTNAVYTIVVTNNGPRAATAVTVTDPTPSGLTFVSNTGACVTAFPCSLGTIASGGTRTITATYSVPPGYTTPDPVLNTATVATTTTETSLLNNSSTASTGVAASQADLALTKTGPVSVVAGNNVTYTITVTNNGPATATGTTVADPTPAGLTFVSNSGDCATAFPCSLGAIASGGTRTITSTYAVPAGYSGANPILNTAAVTANESDPDPSDNTDTESTPVLRSADVSIAKTGPASTGPGLSVVFTVAVTNSGPSNAAGVVVTDPTPAGLTFVSNSGACATAYPCSVGTLTPGQTRTITTTYAVPSNYAGANPVLNTATVTATTPDPDGSDNSSTASVPVVSADLSVVKSDSGVPVSRGDDVTYTIAVTNNGPSLATNVVAVDTLDSSTTYVSDTGGCTQAPVGTLTCPVGLLPSGATFTFNVTVNVGPLAHFAGSLENGACDGSEDLCNRVTVSATQGDPNPANNSDSEPTDVTTVDLSVVKSDASTGVNRLEDMAYTITVSNAGPATATNVVATDTLDPNTTYVSDDLGCTEAPVGILSCPVGTLASGASRTFHVTVQVNADAPIAGARETGDCNAGSDLCNRVVVAATQADSDSSNDRDDEPTNVMGNTTTTDLSIVKTDLTGQVQAGSFSTYQVVVTNNGPGLAREAVVVDTLDANMDFISSTQGCTEQPVGTLACPLGDLAAGASVTFTVTVHVNPAVPVAGAFAGAGCPGTQDLCNRASVSSMAVDSNPSNNVSEVSTDAVAATVVSELSLTKSDVTAEPVQPGANVTYEIVVTNSGPNDAANVVVHETLDPYMAYVSDSVGCVPTSSTNASLYDCPLGTVPAGTSVTLQVVVSIAADAPVSSTDQDGDCDNAQDICNLATVSTSSSDFNIVNNSDSEPTDVSASPSCNDGVVNGAETCDPVSGEICNNGADDDGNGTVDCADPACQAPGFQSCDGNCQLTPVCLPILDDPASIKWNSLHMHGRFIPQTAADPLVDGFTFVLSNEFGTIYSARLLPGDMKVRTKKNISKWLWKDPSARKEGGMRDGLFRVGIHQRPDKVTGDVSYVITVTAYGDMSLATVKTMTTLLYIGDDVAYLTVDWDGKPGSWSLSLKDAILGQ